LIRKNGDRRTQGREAMFRQLMLVSMICAVVTSGSFAAQADKADPGRRFWGLWEAVDSLDGSTEQISISGGGPRSLSLLWRESYWSICDGRRGILRGAGQIDPDNRRVLVIEMAITCFDPEEIVLEDAIRFELVGANMLLATSPGAFKDLPFFRVSGRVHRGRNDED